MRLFDGTGYRLPDNAYWVAGRDSGSDSTPSVAIEVRSKDQSIRGLRDKCRAFRRNGVDVCWLIDPHARTVEVFEGDRDAEQLAADGTLETVIMPGFSLPLADLFAVLDR